VFLQASITTLAETVPKTKALMEFLLSMI